ncbi:Vmc-like lipoprotein signal peptide domain-containing protein [Chryseobacterium sp. GVT01B]
MSSWLTSSAIAATSTSCTEY